VWWDDKNDGEWSAWRDTMAYTVTDHGVGTMPSPCPTQPCDLHALATGLVCRSSAYRNKATVRWVGNRAMVPALRVTGCKDAAVIDLTLQLSPSSQAMAKIPQTVLLDGLAERHVKCKAPGVFGNSKNTMCVV
jgi:hypothetical protein